MDEGYPVYASWRYRLLVIVGFGGDFCGHGKLQPDKSPAAWIYRITLQPAGRGALQMQKPRGATSPDS